MEISNGTAVLRMRDSHRNPEYILKTSLAVFVCLVLLVPSSVSVFHLSSIQDAYAQRQETAVSTGTSTAAPPTAGSSPATSELPQSLQVTDSAMGDTQIPLRASIVNNEPTVELANASQDKGELREYFPIVAFHFDKKPFGFEEESIIVNHVLLGPLKSYDSADSVLGEANYWKDIPLDKKVALEIDHPGLHYFIASVQFANGTSGVYSGTMEVNAIGIKPSSDDSIQFQFGPKNLATGVLKIDQSDTKASESDPAFQLIASRIICSDLNDNGFEVCEDGNENEVLEEDNELLEEDNEDVSRENGNDDNDDDGEDVVEVRGDGGEGGRYDVNNCSGDQCEDADRETEEERNSDDCEINPDLCRGSNGDEDESGEDEGNDVSNENEEE